MNDFQRAMEPKIRKVYAEEIKTLKDLPSYRGYRTSAQRRREAINVTSRVLGVTEEWVERATRQVDRIINQ